MDKEMIKNLKAGDPSDKLALDLRASVEEDYDLIEDIRLPNDYKKIAYEVILAETVKRRYKQLEQEEV